MLPDFLRLCVVYLRFYVYVQAQIRIQNTLSYGVLKAEFLCLAALNSPASLHSFRRYFRQILCFIGLLVYLTNAAGFYVNNVFSLSTNTGKCKINCICPWLCRKYKYFHFIESLIFTRLLISEYP